MEKKEEWKDEIAIIERCQKTYDRGAKETENEETEEEEKKTDDRRYEAVINELDLVMRTYKLNICRRTRNCKCESQDECN